MKENYSKEKMLQYRKSAVEKEGRRDKFTRGGGHSVVAKTTSGFTAGNITQPVIHGAVGMVTC